MLIDNFLSLSGVFLSGDFGMLNAVFGLVMILASLIGTSVGIILIIKAIRKKKKPIVGVIGIVVLGVSAPLWVLLYLERMGIHLV